MLRNGERLHHARPEGSAEPWIAGLWSGGMSASCGPLASAPPPQPGLRRVLWLALAGNASMFALELASGLQAQSLALWADAIDFFADAMAYAITLAVLGSSLRARLRAARFKALVMAALGLWVLGARALAGR
jgi:Co/Zn/Cd efflux system component